MKMIKSLVLGSAAGLIAMGGAQAADLPVKAKAVEYVRICSLYGAGFYYIPGTDTCIKLGGYLRVDAVVNGSGDFMRPNWDGAAGQQTRLRNYFLGRSREDLNIDTRTATELGVVRTFFDATFSWTSGDAIAASDPIGVYYAFIQFAGFTLGKAVSQFDVPWTNYPANSEDFLVGGSGDVTGVQQLTYTAEFGSGISASISLQDPTSYYTTALWNTSGGSVPNALVGAYGTQSIGGVAAPDVVGQLRVDQAWGLFQASVAAHDNRVGYYGATETTGHPTDKWGWAGQLGLSIKNIPTGPGDTINFTAAYSNGASRYVFQSLVPFSYAMFGGTGLVGAYQSVGFAGVSDGVFFGTNPLNGTGIELTTAWGVRGGYTHNWDARWATSLFGAWAAASYTNTAKALICAPIAPSLSLGVAGCNPDFNIWQIGTKTSWTPVKNFTITGEVAYMALDQKYAGTITSAAAVGAKPPAVYELKDQSTWTFGLRAQRNW